MKAYKLKEDKKEYQNVYKAGRVFVMNDNQAVCIATPVEPTVFCGNYLFSKLLTDNLVEEVELENEKWLQPHICKEVRKNMQ